MLTQISIRSESLFLLLVIIYTVPKGTYSKVCYNCSFSLSRCVDLNCHNRPDTCSPRFFTSAIVQSIPCPFGCETLAITDTNGIILEWYRRCDYSGNTRNKPEEFDPDCKVDYNFGVRYEKCLCNQDLCNSTANIKFNRLLLASTSVIWLILSSILT